MPVADALDHVAGYVCANDVSARDIQFADGQWTRGKSFDTFCPVGPIVPADQVPDPQALRIRCLLNGEVVQDSLDRADDLLRRRADRVRQRRDHARAGRPDPDRTPPGVGWARKPPVFLADGDEVTVEIESVGSLTNPVRRA